MKGIYYCIVGLLVGAASCVDTSETKELSALCLPDTIHTVYGDSGPYAIAYDSINRPKWMIMNGSVVYFTYDTQGNLKPSGSSNPTYTYDANNQLVEHKYVDGGTAEYTRTLTFAYNTSGQLISQTTDETWNDAPPNHYIFYYQYPDTATNNFSSIDYGGGSITYFEYDSKQNPLKRLGVVGWFFNPIQEYYPVYFTDSNIVNVRSTGPNGEQTLTYTYTYNEFGYPISMFRYGNQLYRTYTYKCEPQ